LKIVSEFDDGTIKEEEMRLYREGIEYVEGFSEEKFLLRFKETLLEKSLYAYVNFASRQFKVFWLPEDVERIRIGGADNIVFFMKGDTLYRIPFNQLAEEEFELTEDLIVHENVTNYDLDYRGNIFYISVGMLYLVDESGENERLLEKCPGYYKNIALHVNNGSVIMVLRSNEDVRSLFVVESDGDLVLLTESLRDQPFIGVNNQVLYMDTANHLFAYDIYGEDKIYIMQFDQEISLVGWYGEFGHFLYKENGDLLLEDVYSANRYLLMHEEDKEYEYYVNGRSIFYYDKHNLQLSRLYFDEIE